MTPCRDNARRTLLAPFSVVAMLALLGLFTGCRNASDSSTADATPSDPTADIGQGDHSDGSNGNAGSGDVGGKDAGSEMRSGGETDAVAGDADPTADGDTTKNPSTGFRESGETENIASESGMNRDAMLALAAGPMADTVNSSLVRLNTNLGKKEHTLVLMALRSETLRWYFLTHMTDIIDESQLQQATELIDSYEPRFQDLLNRRASILETVRDGDQVAELLDINRVACIKLAMQLRQQILRTVLTADQRAAYAAKFEKKKDPPKDEQKPGD